MTPAASSAPSSPTVHPASDRQALSDPPNYSPPVASALERGRDRLLTQITTKLKAVPGHSLQGSLYVLLGACVRHYCDRISRLQKFRAMGRAIESGEIGGVPAFVAHLPQELGRREIEILEDAEVEQASVTLRMLGVIEELRAQISPADTVNLAFYNRLRERVEDGVITGFGQFAAQLPEFITNTDPELRGARGSYLSRQESANIARSDFMSAASREAKGRHDRDSSHELIYRALELAIPDFAELRQFEAWWNLLQQNGHGIFESPTDFLHFVPIALRPRLSRIVSELVAQARRTN